MVENNKLDQITIGTKVFLRTDEFEGLLRTIPEGVGRVIIADDGNKQDRTHLYEKDWGFKIKVIDLEYDAGVGAGRARIVEELKNPYLLMVDPDHRIPANVDLLLSQLRQSPELAGVGGLVMEKGRVSGHCHNFREKNGVLIRFRGKPKTEKVAEYPLLRFNFVPQAVLVRKEALSDYTWDPYFISAKDHLDFMIGQWRCGWEWGVSPSVLFDHVETDSQAYNESRQNLVAWYKSKRYIMKKWGYRQIIFEGNDAAFSQTSIKERLKGRLPTSINTIMSEMGDRKNYAIGKYR